MTTTPTTGRREAAPTKWHGPEALLRSYGIDPSRSVELRDLRSLMHGFSPWTVSRSGRRARIRRGSRAIDLTFSPPKTVSALWATSGPYRRAQIEVAHREAVKSALERTEREVALVRRKTDGVVRYEKPKRLLAVESVHTTAAREGPRHAEDPRPATAQPRRGDRSRTQRRVVAAVESKQLFRAASENGAWYRAELARTSRDLGLPIERRTATASATSRSKASHGAGRALVESQPGRRPSRPDLPPALRPRAKGRRAGQPHPRDPRQQVRRHPSGRERRMAGTRRRAQPDPQRSEELFNDWGLRNEPKIDLAKELLAEVTRDSSMVTKRELRAKAYELSAGVGRPAEADRLVDDLARSGELLQLEDGTWTTRQPPRARADHDRDRQSDARASTPRPSANRRSSRPAERSAERSKDP